MTHWHKPKHQVRSHKVKDLGDFWQYILSFLGWKISNYDCRESGSYIAGLHGICFFFFKKIYQKSELGCWTFKFPLFSLSKANSNVEHLYSICFFPSKANINIWIPFFSLSFVSLSSWLYIVDISCLTFEMWWPSFLSIPTTHWHSQASL